MCLQVIARLQKVANGHWNLRNRKRLEGTKGGLNLFEAKINSGQRILWEVAVSREVRAGMAHY